MCTETRMRWETNSKWYEAILMLDLFGHWVVFRSWGAKDSKRYGHKTSFVGTYEKGCDFLTRLDKRRKGRVPAYQNRPIRTI